MFLQIKTPFTMHVLGVGIGRSEDALHPDPFVHFRGKAGKFAAVHFLAYIFPETPFEARFLGGAGGN